MTDRLKGCTVAFEQDIRDDDAEKLLDAIRQLRGVVAVTGAVATGDDWMNRERVRLELAGRVIAVLSERS